MLEHLQTIAGRLESIDTNLAGLTETARLLLHHAMQNSPAATSAGKLEPLLGKEEVMEYLDIKETTYYRWVREGKLVPRGGKGQHRYYPSDIAKLTEQRKYRKRG